MPKESRNISRQLPGLSGSTLALRSNTGTRLPMKGAFIASKRSIHRSNPMSRFIILYLL